MDLHSSKVKWLFAVGFMATLIAGGAPETGAAITLLNLEFDNTDEEGPGELGNGIISIGDDYTIRIQADNDQYPSTDISIDLRTLGGPSSAVMAVTPASDWPASIFSGDWNPAWDSTLGPLPCAAPADHEFLIRAPHDIGPTVTGAVAVVDSPAFDVVDEEWRIYYETAPGGVDWDLAMGTVSGAFPVVYDTVSAAYYIPDLPPNAIIVFTAEITSYELPACYTSPPDPNQCDHIYFATLAGPCAGEVYQGTWEVADAGDYWVDNSPGGGWYPVSREDPLVFGQITATDAGLSDTTFRSLAAADLMPWQSWDTHGLLPPASEFDEAADYDLAWILDNAGLAALFGAADEVLNPSNAGFGYAADEVQAHLDLTGLSHGAGNDDIIRIELRLGLLGFYPDWQIGWDLLAGGYYGVAYPDDPGSPWDFSNTYPVLEATFPLTATDADPWTTTIELRMVTDSGDEYYLPLDSLTSRLPAIDNIIPHGEEYIFPDDITYGHDLAKAGDATELNPESYDNPEPDSLKVFADLRYFPDSVDVVDGGWVFADFSWIGWNNSSPAGSPNSEAYWVPMEYGPGDGWDWASGMVPVIVNPDPQFSHDDNGDPTGVTRVLIVDNAGNTWGPLAAADSMPPVDNILPAVVCPSSNFYVEIAEDMTGDSIANVGWPEGDVFGNPYQYNDRVVFHADAGDWLGADEIRDVRTAGFSFCDSIFLYDDGLSGSDPVFGDKNYTGQLRIRADIELDPWCGLDNADVGFDFIITDNSGNKWMGPTCPGFGVDVDNIVPMMSAACVDIRFWDDIATPGLDGDVNSNGIVNQGDQIIFEWSTACEDMSDGEVHPTERPRVLEESIDPLYGPGEIMLDPVPPGGLWRSAPYTIGPGTTISQPLSAAFNVWDNAGTGNSQGYRVFDSGLTLNNVLASMGLAKSDGLDEGECAEPGDTVTYRIVYENPNPDTINGVVVEDRLPYQAGFISASHGGLYEYHSVAWSPGQMAGTAAETVYVVVEIGPAALPGDELADTCWVTSLETGPTQAVETTPICAQQFEPLYLVKSDNVTTCAEPGQEVTYSITYANFNADSVTNVVLRDGLAAEVEFVSATGGGTYDAGVHEVVWDIGILWGGDANEVDLVVSIAGDTPFETSIADTATITSAETGISQAADTTQVCGPFLPLTLSKDDNLGGAPAQPGDTIRYTIYYGNPNMLMISDDPGVLEKNPGDADRRSRATLLRRPDRPARNVGIIDMIPDSTDFEFATGGGIFDPVLRRVTWSIGTLPSGASGSVDLGVSVSSTLPLGTTLVNICWITCDETDPTYTEASESTLVAEAWTPLSLDIKPGGCPNPINVKSKGVLPAAILGCDGLDVHSIDPGTVCLVRDGMDRSVAPLRWAYEDVATPFPGEPCGCHGLGRDGFTDLTLKFDTQEVVDAFNLNEDRGQMVLLSVLCSLLDGSPMLGSDCVRVLDTGPRRDRKAMRGFGFDPCDPLVCHIGSGVAISFYVEEAGVVHLDIYDVRGRTVRELVQDSMSPGNHAVVWNGTDDHSRRVWPGVYFLRLRSAGKEATKKVLVVE